VSFAYLSVGQQVMAGERRVSLPVEQVAGDIKAVITERRDGGHSVTVPAGIYRITTAVGYDGRGADIAGFLQIRTVDNFDQDDPGNISRVDVATTPRGEYRSATTVLVTTIADERSPITIEMSSVGDETLIAFGGWVLIERLG
jgi:hypothetical protein